MGTFCCSDHSNFKFASYSEYLATLQLPLIGSSVDPILGRFLDKLEKILLPENTKLACYMIVEIQRHESIVKFQLLYTASGLPDLQLRIKETTVIESTIQ